jgi:nitroreductase
MPLPASAVPPPPLENEPVDAVHESAEMLSLLARRRSAKVGHLGEPGPNDDQINALLRLAARVPDHGKLGPWRFIVVAGAARARAGEALASVIANDDGVDESRLAAARNLLQRAPVCVIVVSSPTPSLKAPDWEQEQSAAMASFALLLGAHAMGFGGCILTEWPTYDARARAALSLKEHERIAGFVYLGTPREAATERFRADLASRVSRY